MLPRMSLRGGRSPTWQSVSPVPKASLCEGGGAKRRRERTPHPSKTTRRARCTPRVLVPLRSTAPSPRRSLHETSSCHVIARRFAPWQSVTPSPKKQKRNALSGVSFLYRTAPNRKTQCMSPLARGIRRGRYQLSAVSSQPPRYTTRKYHPRQSLLLQAYSRRE